MQTAEAFAPLGAMTLLAVTVLVILIVNSEPRP